MAEYIARHKDQLPLQELEDLKNTCEYGCSDPRLNPRHQEPWGTSFHELRGW